MSDRSRPFLLKVRMLSSLYDLTSVYASCARCSPHRAYACWRLNWSCMYCAHMLSLHGIRQSKCLCMPQGGKVVDKVEGADAAAVTRMVQKQCPQSEASSQKAGSIAPPAAFSNRTALHAQAANGSQSLEQRVDQLINKQPIMLFMKVLFLSNADLPVP